MDIDPNRLDGINAHETHYLYEEIFVRRAYLPRGRTLPPDAVVFDVGANIGMYSLFVHAECPDATVYAFEPMPPAFEKLRSNLTAHGVRAHLCPYALSDTAGEVEFTYYPGYSTMSATSSHAATEADRDFIRRQVLERPPTEIGDSDDDLDILDEMLDYRFREVPYRCETRRLSEVVDEQGVTRIDMLKVDVQRAEADVLRGVDERHWPMVRRIALEVHDEPGTATEGRLALLTEELRDRGFEVGAPLDDGLVDSGRYSLFGVRPGTGA
ncbi:FkbM family methyltransferase [Streptomyces sp. st77]|uniref:FkbM family methyltransferase n=1 Tax=Streptomyces sp. st77 TaxID=1828074 RepID=UPI0015CF645F|nr:FkbM family methyltransferase [Streptomyces sp. st77]